jgi:glycosyltransferase involved in cell wall biosynthesis
MDLSVVIPVCNEEESISALINEITHAFERYQHENIVIDDGSSDSTISFLLK